MVYKLANKQLRQSWSSANTQQRIAFTSFIHGQFLWHFLRWPLYFILSHGRRNKRRNVSVNLKPFKPQAEWCNSMEHVRFCCFVNFVFLLLPKLGYLCKFVQSPDAHTFFGVSMLMRMLQQFCTCVKNYAHTSRIEEWNFLFVFVPGTNCMAVYCFCCQLLRCAACLCAACACAFHKWKKKSKNGTFELKNKKQ